MTDHEQASAINLLLPHAEARQEVLQLLAFHSPQYQTRYEDCRHAVSYAYEALKPDAANLQHPRLGAVTRIWSLPPDPEGMNDDRAKWAAAALRQFQSATGTDLEDALADLLGDLMHWCDRNAVIFEDELSRARFHYQAETLSEDPEPIPSAAEIDPSGTPITAEPPNPPTTKTYRAEFFTAADYAFRSFEAETPEQALELARQFYEEDGDLDFRSYDDNAALDQIQIWDSKRGTLASWESDDYRLHKASAQLLRALQAQTIAVKAILDHWEKGDLAAAVRHLNASIPDAEDAIAAAVASAKSSMAGHDD
jgi:hypothetical protein